MNASDQSLHRYFSPSATHGFLWRSIDLVTAVVATIVLAPLMLMIAIALAPEGARSVLFAQTRMGSGARPFRMSIPPIAGRGATWLRNGTPPLATASRGAHGPFRNDWNFHQTALHLSGVSDPVKPLIW